MLQRLGRLLLNQNVQLILYPALAPHRSASQLAARRALRLKALVDQASARADELSDLVVASGVKRANLLFNAIDRLARRSSSPVGPDEVLSLLRDIRLELGEIGACEVRSAALIAQIVCFRRLYDVIVTLVLGGKRGDGDCVATLMLAIKNLGEYDDEFAASRLLPHEEVLMQDSHGSYRDMDRDTKHVYRCEVERIAKLSGSSPIKVARAAAALCDTGVSESDLARIRTHIGYYLLGAGVCELHAALGVPHRRILSQRSRIFLKALSTALVAVPAFCGVACFFPEEFDWRPVSLIAHLALVAASLEGASQVTDVFAGQIFRRRGSLRMRHERRQRKFTAVCVPVLVSSQRQLDGLGEVLARNARSVLPDQACFVLLTDFPDALSQEQAKEEGDLLLALASMVDSLRREFGPRFICLHRERIYSKTQKCYMGWERKRGKIECFNNLVVAGDDAFSFRCGDVGLLQQVEHVFVLDEDSLLASGAVESLEAVLSHPLNQPIVEGGRLLSGHAVIAPATQVRREALAGWRAASFFAGGQVVVPRNLFYDLFGVRQFSGKGYYDARAYRSLLSGRLPENRLLSHDTVEGAWLEPGHDDRANVTEGFPADYLALCERQHRWCRGDFQNFLLWAGGLLGLSIRLAPSGPGFLGYYLLRLIRHRAFQILLPFLIVVGVAAAAHARPELLAVPYLLLLGPALLDVLISTLRSPGLIFSVPRALVRLHCFAALRVLTCLHQAAIVGDACVRASWRMASGRQLLDWTAASAIERQGSRTLVHKLWLSCALMVAATAVAALLSGLSWMLTAALLVLWVGSSLCAAFVFNRAGR